MPDENTQDKVLPPPQADSIQADRYIKWLVELIDREKVLVNHSDLSRYNVDFLKDHYRISLKDYDVEVSHSKTPDKGEDMYVMLFNNLKTVTDGTNQRVILTYLHLSSDQFTRFRTSAENQMNTIKRRIEEKRFKDAMAPVEMVMEELSNNQESVVEKAVVAAFPNQSQVTPQAPIYNTPPKETPTPNLVKPPLPSNTEPASQTIPETPTQASAPTNTAPPAVA